MFFKNGASKDLLQKMPLGKLILHTFLENVAQINKNNNRTMPFTSKQVSLLKMSTIVQKMKINPKRDVHPFCTKSFNIVLFQWKIHSLKKAPTVVAMVIFFITKMLKY